MGGVSARGVPKESPGKFSLHLFVRLFVFASESSGSPKGPYNLTRDDLYY